MDMKKTYIIPMAQCLHVQMTGMLAGSNEELIFDPGDGTDEALTKEQHTYNVWDDDWSQQ